MKDQFEIAPGETTTATDASTTTTAPGGKPGVRQAVAPAMMVQWTLQA